MAIEPAAEKPEARRISLAIDYPGPGGQPVRATRLTSWVYRIEPAAATRRRAAQSGATRGRAVRRGAAMNSNTIYRGRRGFTLIEVGIAITLAAIVLGSATAMLVGMIRTNDAVHERLEQIAIRSHLSDRFRADVMRPNRAKRWTKSSRKPASCCTPTTITPCDMS